MLKTTAAEIQAQYNMGKRDFPKSNLKKINWRKAKLRDINLQNSDLREADLRGADLSNADLSNCYFNQAYLSGAKLTRANLQGAHLIKAYFIETNFVKANLKNAFLTGSHLTKANFRKADLSGSNLDQTHINETNFRGAIYDEKTRFNREVDAESLGMSFVSSGQENVGKKMTLAEAIDKWENFVTITNHYLGDVMTIRNFEDSRPNVSWLKSFNLDKQGKIKFKGSLNQEASLIQLLWIQQWNANFIKKSSLIVQDLPDLIKEKNLNIG